MSNQHTSLAEIIALLERAASLLASADHTWWEAAERELGGIDAPEVAEIKERLHSATHEAGTQLEGDIWDIRQLLARLDVRARYEMFSNEQFAHIVSHGWSTALVYAIRGQHPDLSLAELSALVKRVCADWGKRP
jgi:hypothetical protein